MFSFCEVIGWLISLLGSRTTLFINLYDRLVLLTPHINLPQSPRGEPEVCSLSEPSRDLIDDGILYELKAE